MGEVTYRSFDRAPDRNAIIELWNLCITADPMTDEIYDEKIIGDPNFDPAGCPVAVADGKIVGFAISSIRRAPNDGRGYELDRGWITAFAVHPYYRRQGIGSALIQHCTNFIKGKDRSTIYVCGLTGSSPKYFFPGVDVKAYPAAIKLLEKHGFFTSHLAHHMERPLADYSCPQDVKKIEDELKRQGITVQMLEAGEEKDLLEFLWHHFPGDWYRHVDIVMNQSPDNYVRFFTAKMNGKIVGYCHYEEAHFGPFLVRFDLRSKNIGTIMFHKCVEHIKKLGYPTVWFGWADEPIPARFYRKNGMTEVRSFAMMRKGGLQGWHADS
jgi:GNAT superfamily N-acetyltransferase